MKKTAIILFYFALVLFIPLKTYSLVVCVNGSGNLRTEKREVNTFNVVVIKCSANVTFVKTGGVQIECDDNIMHLLYSRVENNILTIGSDTIICPTKINIYLPETDLKAISMDGSGSIYVDYPMNVESLSIKLSGSGNINFKNITTNELSIEVLGSGIIKASGTANKFNAYLDGSGTVNAEDLKTIRARASMGGSGMIKLFAEERISTIINGSGIIEYKCNTTDVDKTINGSGSIIMIENK